MSAAGSLPEKYIFNTKISKSKKNVYSESLEYYDEIFEVIEKERLHAYDGNDESVSVQDLESLNVNVRFSGFKNDGTNTFSKNSELNIGFELYKYFINNDGKNSAETSLVTKLYSEPLTEDEIKSIVKDTVAKLFEDIKASIKS